VPLTEGSTTIFLSQIEHWGTERPTTRFLKSSSEPTFP